MLNTQEFGDFLHSVGLKDFVGVPCSYLSPLINYAINEKRFIMSNNEGDAVAIASGISLGHSSCGDFLASASPCSLRRMPNTPHSQSLHSPKNSSAILECQGESLPKESHSVSESSPKNSGGISESIFLDSHSLLESTTSDSKASPSCHSEPLSSESSPQDSNPLLESSPSDSNANTKSPRATYGIVLMQNSGLSNALSPLTSLNHTFKIPILGFVSLRGERDAQGKNTDEPQHELLGIITDKLLETCQVPYAFLDSDMERAKRQVAEALAIMSRGESFFFIVREGTFSKVKLLDSAKHLDSNSRHSALSDKSAILHSDFRLRTSSARPQSSLESPDFSSQILECQDSTTLNSKIISESTLSDSHSIIESCVDSLVDSSPILSESAIPVIASVAKQSIKTDSEKIDCHEATASRNDNKIESKPHTSLESPTDSESKNQTESTMDRNSKKLETNPKASHTTQKPLPTRLNALETIHALALKYQALLLATTGKCGRELYEIKDTPNQLYMVGSMGCVSALSLGLSLASPQKVIAIDGDSALLMRLGTLSTNAYYARGNFCHILLDNESHDSTGGQFNLSPFVSFPSIARACGYTHVYEARNIEELALALKEFLCDSNSSLGNHSRDCVEFGGQSLPLEVTPAPKSTQSPQSNTANTRIVRGEIQDSKAVSESTTLDSHSISESTPCHSEQSEESTNHTNGDISAFTKPQYDKDSESKAPSYFIYLKIAKGSKDNLGRPKITPQDVAKRLSAYMQEWRQNHAHIESSQNLADTQNKTRANGTQDLQTLHNPTQALQTQNSHTSHTKEQQ